MAIWVCDDCGEQFDEDDCPTRTEFDDDMHDRPLIPKQVRICPFCGSESVGEENA